MCSGFEIPCRGKTQLSQIANEKLEKLIAEALGVERPRMAGEENEYND